MMDLANDVVQLLESQNWKLVLAESCTCGRVAAELGLVPGVSQWLCGSWVVYRASSKEHWLGIPADFLEHYSTESLECSRELAVAALERTPEATVVAGITGDLGPGAPEEKDGRVYVVVGKRVEGATPRWTQRELKLVNTDRAARQLEATRSLLRLLLEWLEDEAAR